MNLIKGMSQVLAVALGLAVLRHLLFLEAVLVEPAAVLKVVEAEAVVRELPAAAALPLIRSGAYQPVDLRRDAALPFIGNQLAWSLPLPHSMTILARYKDNATASRLVFVVTEAEREEGLMMLRKICRELQVHQAILVVGGL